MCSHDPAFTSDSFHFGGCFTQQHWEPNEPPRISSQPQISPHTVSIGFFVPGSSSISLCGLTRTYRFTVCTSATGTHCVVRVLLHATRPRCSFHFTATLWHIQCFGSLFPLQGLWPMTFNRHRLMVYFTAKKIDRQTHKKKGPWADRLRDGQANRQTGGQGVTRHIDRWMDGRAWVRV